MLTSQTTTIRERLAWDVTPELYNQIRALWIAHSKAEDARDLQGLIDTGVKLDARLSAEVLLTIFHPNTPLHDGGVIARQGRIAAAACGLPRTTSHIDDYHMGLRHRAGIGVTEGTDAVAIIVSEERGTTSIAHEGRLIFAVETDRLEGALIEFLQPGLGLRRAGMWPSAWFRPRGR